VSVVESDLLIEISTRDMDRVTYQNLIECRDRLKNDLKQDNKVFHVKQKKDRKLIKAHVKALTLAAKYFKEM